MAGGELPQGPGEGPDGPARQVAGAARAPRGHGLASCPGRHGLGRAPLAERGRERRPILSLNGASPLCETFFTDVKVPKAQLFGPRNGGWTGAKRRMQFERD